MLNGVIIIALIGAVAYLIDENIKLKRQVKEVGDD